MTEDYYQEPPKKPDIEWTEIFGDVTNTSHIPADPSRQLVIVPKANVSLNAIKSWADKRFKNGEVSLVSICGSCDTSLLLIEGPGVANYLQTDLFIQGDVATGGSRNTGGTIRHDDGPVYVSPNYPVNIPIDFINEALETVPLKQVEGYEYEEEIVVAVLDTGLEPEVLKNFLYTSGSQNQPCIEGAEKGWNFVAGTSETKDDNDSRHGTAVSSFIIEQAIKCKSNPVRIVPVKVHNHNGESDLYSVLCALAYAKDIGAKIINASFGFYVPRKCGLKDNEEELQQVFLLNEFVEKYIKDDVFLIAAAGNRDQAFFHHYFRDLDYISFYPACFSRSNKNVFAVTTIDEDEVCPTQNFSANVVDVGVYADTTDFQFFHPFHPDNLSRAKRGSSFAAPIFAGRLAANFSHIKKKLDEEGVPFTKSNILDLMRDEPLLSRGNNNNLSGLIKNGFAISKIDHA